MSEVYIDPFNFVFKQIDFSDTSQAFGTKIKGGYLVKVEDEPFQLVQIPKAEFSWLFQVIAVDSDQLIVADSQICEHFAIAQQKLIEIVQLIVVDKETEELYAKFECIYVKRGNIVI